MGVSLIMAASVPTEMVSLPLVFARSASRRSSTELELDLDVTTRWTLVCFPMALLAEVSTELLVGVPAPVAPAVPDRKTTVASTAEQAPTRPVARRSTDKQHLCTLTPARSWRGAPPRRSWADGHRWWCFEDRRDRKQVLAWAARTTRPSAGRKERIEHD